MNYLTHQRFQFYNLLGSPLHYEAVKEDKAIVWMFFNTVSKGRHPANDK